MENSEFICESHIISQYGIPISLIRKFFGEPDNIRPNPHCPSGNRKIRLYKKDRIKWIMKSFEFQEALSKSRKLSESRKRKSSYVSGPVGRQIYQ
jgi:hypothetical protein